MPKDRLAALQAVSIYCKIQTTGSFVIVYNCFVIFFITSLTYLYVLKAQHDDDEGQCFIALEVDKGNFMDQFFEQVYVMTHMKVNIFLPFSHLNFYCIGIVSLAEYFIYMKQTIVFDRLMKFVKWLT